MSTIYLHFLNREISRPFGFRNGINNVSQILFTICATLDCIFYSNYANLVEGDHLKKDFVKKLFELDIIKIHGERTSLIEYWSTRDKRYDFDSSRYPYKKDIESESLLLTPSLIRGFSMTNMIKSSIKKDLIIEDDRFKINRNRYEKRVFWELNEQVLEKEQEAITVSLADSVLKNNISLSTNEKMITSSNAGKFYSALYIEAVCNDLNATIIKGIDGIIFYDNVIKNSLNYDIRILSYFFRKINFTNNIENLVFWRESNFFKKNADLIKNIILTLSEVTPQNNAYEIIETLRHNEENFFENVNSDPNKFYDSLLKLKLKLEKLNNFKKIYNKNSKMKDPILIVTATTKETQELLKIFSSHLGSESQILFVGNRAVNLLGIISNCEIYHTQCEAGSSGTSGSQAVITEVVSYIKPSSVLMPGIAFGLDKVKQKMGDILISTYVREYEKVRLGENEIKPRGAKIPASDSLIGLFRLLESKWNHSNLHFGTMMSGEKLVDDQKFVKHLLEIEPEAIGGEMEGVGLFTAAYNSKIDWILLKSIVDWGMTKDDEQHEKSANLSSKLLFEAVKILCEK